MMKGRRLIFGGIVAAMLSIVTVAGLVAANDQMEGGLDALPEHMREMERFYRENKDEREPMEGPYRFALTVDGERVIICETTLEDYEAHNERIWRQLQEGEWEEMSRYCPLTEDAQEIMNSGDVQSVLQSVEQQ